MNPRERLPEYKLWEKTLYFFPVQLFFVHLKKNLLLLFFWVLLFAIVTKSITLKYGIPYLFLFPEYLGQVNFLSHFVVGLVTGSFIMAFNLSSYVVNGFRFPFLATLNRPFIKYCQNNFIIPASYSLVYIISLAIFQWEYEKVNSLSIALNILGFIAGNLIFIALTALYFIATNKNVFHFLGARRKQTSKQYINPVHDLFSNRNKWMRTSGKSRKEWKVTTYISTYGRIALARDSSHYNRAMLEKVFSQNRVNASIFQLMIIVLLFVLGLFHEYPVLNIPAAASILLFFTMLIMLASAIYSWFRGWTTLVFLALLFALNFISQKEPWFYLNQAYGLDYTGPKAVYSNRNILRLQENSQLFYLDVQNGMRMLENWKDRTGDQKPVAVFLNVPGGGLRSAIWTFYSVSQAIKATNDKLWRNMLFISGSSGGMIGAAYLREYYYRLSHGNDTLPPCDELIEDLAADKLNPVAATAVLNDMFFRFKKFEYSGRYYTKDRAYAFERKLNQDTRGWMDRKLIDYTMLEHSAKMPMMVLAPTISNDGRKLIISSQPVAYLCHNNDSNQMNENLEFRRFFEAQDADNLSFLSALRMSATFPYVFPAASLPSKPTVDVLDAGIRDNYGMSNTLKFIYFFREWLAANTSGIIIIQVRDREKFSEPEENLKPSLLENLIQPVGTFYNTVINVQDYQMDDQIRMAHEWYRGDLHIIELALNRSKTNPISLSWHLTEKEKERVLNAIHTDANQRSLKKLRELLPDK
ncbi:MAG: hypothetical protein Kow0075_07540 [Salibacteraceae bacterium]